MIALAIEGAIEPGGLAWICDDARALLAVLERADRELSLVLCDDPFIQDLNRRWRGLDQPTDVLSFPQGDDFGGRSPLLGDVIISLDRAALQADERGHGLHTELKVLLIHGLLHLLGHEHHGPEGCARMAAEEVRLLGVLGVDVGGLVARSGVLGVGQR
ncbi:MAG TPA: rRNA maturation RNase YbeY [Deltaproteobacteria bacterium]|nr:rRNA maturation RNase YbeY [Deltaproteobacteria bacterium]